MVRLRVLTPLYYRLGVIIFQFQYGAVKSIDLLDISVILLFFQFQYGAVKSIF